jgi:hypothetical protein
VRARKTRNQDRPYRCGRKGCYVRPAWPLNLAEASGEIALCFPLPIT